MRVLVMAVLVFLAGCAGDPAAPPPDVPIAQTSQEPVLPPVEGEPGTVPTDPVYRVASSEHAMYIECQVSLAGMGPYCNDYKEYTAVVEVDDAARVARIHWTTNYTDGLQTYLAFEMEDGSGQGGYSKDVDPDHELVVSLENVTAVRVGLRAADLGLSDDFATGWALDAHGRVALTFYLDGVPEGLQPRCLTCIVE